MAEIRFADVTRVFRGMWKPAVDGVALDVREGELLALTGASGSGKSTLLRMLAGLEPVDSGKIYMDGEDITRTAPDKRGVSMLAQGFALFPQLTVQENIAFPLTMRKRSSAKSVAARVAAIAEQCGVAEQLPLKPAGLSFDLRQRAMMARALVGHPKVVCLDEPLAGSGVPFMMRGRTPIATLQRQFGVTMVYATCSSTDASSIADRVAVLERGALHQVGTPAEVFDRPASVAVAEFVGAPPMNLIPAVVADGVARVGGLKVKVGAEQAEALTSERVLIGLRPEDLFVGPAEFDEGAGGSGSGGGAGATAAADGAGPGEQGGLRAVTVLVKDSGRDRIVHARTETADGSSVDLVIRQTRGAAPVRGETLLVGANTAHAHLFDAASGRRLPD